MAVHGFIVLRDRAIEVVHPPTLREEIAAYVTLHPSLPLGATQPHRLVIEAEGSGQFSLSSSRSDVVLRNLTAADTLHRMMIAADEDLVVGFGREAMVLRAAGVAKGDRAILMPGLARTGKSTLAAWFTEKGFRFLSDGIVAVSSQLTVQDLVRPLVMRPDVWAKISDFSWVTRNDRLSDGRQLVAPPDTADRSGEQSCGLILFVDFQSGVSPRLERLSRARAATLLMANNHSALRFEDHGLSVVASLAAGVPVLRLRYGHLNQIEAARLDSVVGRLIEPDRNESGIEAAIADVNATFRDLPRADTVATPVRSPLVARSSGDVTLTIGMATYDDYDGVYFTIQALRLYHPDNLSNTEIVVIDNHPDGICGEPLRKLMKSVPHGRYIPYLARSGTSVRDRIFEEAQGSLVLSMDCHVMLAPGAIAQLLAYVRQRPETRDLLQGPLLNDDLTQLGSHWDPVWRGGMFGIWGDDPRAHSPETDPFEIPMQGLGVFACRKEAWLGFNPRFRGFGGEEGYIHEKFRQAGHRTLCLPFLRWIHRFARPLGIPYPSRPEDRIHNYLVGFAELGLPATEMRAHFDQFYGAEQSRMSFTKAYQLMAQFGAEHETPM